MAVSRSIPLQTYTPQTVATDFTIPASTQRITARFTCVGWPSGPCLELRLTQPDGAHGGGAIFHGGVIGKDGLPLTSASISQELGPSKSWQQGKWTVEAIVIQTLSTAITIERF